MSTKAASWPTMPSEAQRRANAKQDAARKRVALWLEPADVKALDKAMRKLKAPSRIAALRALLSTQEQKK